MKKKQNSPGGQKSPPAEPKRGPGRPSSAEFPDTGFAADFRLRRESLGLSRLELSIRSGVSPSAIWKIEIGAMSPTLDCAGKLAAAMDAKIVLSV